MKARRSFITFFVLVLMSLAVFVAEKSAYAIYAERGDIVLWGNKIVEYGDPGYTSQRVYLGHVHMARQAGIYDSFFGGPLHTWDDQDVSTGGAPTQEKYVWQHVEVQTQDGEVDEKNVDEIVVLKPKAAMRNSVNIDLMASFYQEFRYSQDETGLSTYNQPLPFSFFRWVKHAYYEDLAFAWLSDARNIWIDLYGVDPANPVPQNQAQSYVTNDIEDLDFFLRSTDCSSMTAWSVLAGMNYYNPNYRNVFLTDQAAVNAVDCMAPGQVAYYLWNRGWVDVEFYPQTERLSPEENGNVSEWNDALGTGAHSATQSPSPAVGNYCRRISTAGNPVAGQWYWLRYNAGKIASPSQTTFYVYLPNPGAGSRPMEVFAYNGSARLINWIGFDEPSHPGAIVVYEGGWVPIVSNYTPNTWLKITCAWDWANDRWDIYVNDVLKRSGIPFVNSSSGFKFWNDRFDYSGTGITAYMDHGENGENRKARDFAVNYD
ncbi:MAG: hypothetical protein ACLFUL_06330 [Desulfobacteraceae bacterium]